MAPVIVDIHTHIYPDPVASGTLKRVCERASIPAYTDGTLRGLLASMESAGIDLSVVSSVATRPEQVSAIHDWLLGIEERRVLPLAVMHPDLPAGELPMRFLKEKGIRGFKVHPDYQDFFADEKRMYPFYETVQAAGMFVLFHAGVDRGLPDPIHATPENLARVHRDFPGLVMIAAHMGGESLYEEAERHLLGKDIYLDTSFVLRRMPLPTVERFFLKHPLDRFLFGSDSPWTDQGDDLRFLLSLPFLSDEAKEMILGTNAARLLRIT
ncbi:MAG: amidohydrolase family protein [Thermodesulfobacteriota bacterium]